MGFFKKVGKFIKKNVKSAGKDIKKGVAKTVSRKAREFYRAGGEEGVAKRATEAAAAAEATQLKVTEEQGKKDAAAAAIVDAEAVKAKTAADALAAANAANAAANAAGNARATGFGAASMSREAGLTATTVAAAPVAATPVAVAPIAAPVAEAPITPLTQRRSNSSPIRQLSPSQVVQGKINPKAVDMKAINSLFNSPPKNNKNNINNKKK